MTIPVISNAALPDLSYPPLRKSEWGWMTQRLVALIPVYGERKAFEAAATEFFERQGLSPSAAFRSKFTQELKLATYGLLHNDPLLAVPIKENFIANLEHGSIAKVRGIVLHQTGSASAKATLRTWKTRPYGTHFLIDTDGTIYQTARLSQYTWHVGKLLPRCKNEGNCSPVETKAIKVLEKKPVSFGKRASLIHRQELEKNYPKRYPRNRDSIGIEVVGLFDPHRGYGPPTKEQQAALDLLVNALTIKYHLTLKDVYAHGRIARKQETEAIYLGY